MRILLWDLVQRQGKFEFICLFKYRVLGRLREQIYNLDKRKEIFNFEGSK